MVICHLRRHLENIRAVTTERLQKVDAEGKILLVQD